MWGIKRSERVERYICEHLGFSPNGRPLVGFHSAQVYARPIFALYSF